MTASAATCKQTSVHACVVAYGSSRHLDALVDALTACSTVHSVAIVDNGAIIADRLRAGGLSQVRVTSAGGNVGYSRGVNVAAELAPSSTSHLLVINPDVVPFPSAVDLLAHESAEHRFDLSAGQLDEHGSVGANYRTATSLQREALKAVLGAKRTWRRASEPTHPSGAFMLIALSAWNRHGQFSEEFELYYEDVELVDRYLEQGATVHLSELVVGRHEAGASARESGTAYAALRLSRLRYLRRRFGVVGSVVAAGLTLVEFLTRVLTRRTAWSTWYRTMWATCREVARPHSVRLLQGRPS